MKRTTLVVLMALLIPASLVIAQPWGGRGSGDCDGPRMMSRGFGMHDGMRSGKWMGRGMGAGFDGAPGAMMLIRNAEKIGLTADQKAKIEDMSTRFQTERIDKKAELEKARVQLRALMAKDKPVQADVLAGIDKVTKLQGDLKKMQYTHHVSVRDLLTTEQQEKIKSLRTERWEKRWGDRDDRRGMRRGAGPSMQGDS